MQTSVRNLLYSTLLLLTGLDTMFVPTPDTRPEYGMSPKKSHEVNRMTAFSQDMIASLGSATPVKHIVDVGAGQVCLLASLFIGRCTNIAINDIAFKISPSSLERMILMI